MMNRGILRHHVNAPERTGTGVVNDVRRLDYVLRRYAGLEVYEPRIQNCSQTAAASNSNGTRAEVAPISSESSDFNFPLDLESRRPDGSMGAFTPLFGGRIVLGPERWYFAMYLSLLAALLALVIMEKELIETYCGGPIAFIAGNVLCGLSFLTFFKVGITDPGVVPKVSCGTESSWLDIIRETREFRQKHPGAKWFRECYKCGAFRGPRTYHCSRCDICIRQQDLHLVTCGICVGERNRVSYFLTVLFQTSLGIFMLATNLVIAAKLKQEMQTFQHYTSEKAVFSGIGACAGVVLLLMPQTGVLMLIYRFYLICVGRTAREEYRKYHFYDANDCLVDTYPVCANIWRFFCRKSRPSIFQRSGRVSPEDDMELMPTHSEVIRIFGGAGARRDSDDLIRIPDFRRTDQVNNNMNSATPAEMDDAMRLRALAEIARGRSTPSVPLFEQDLKMSTKRIRIPRKSKPASVLQQRISAFQEARQLPKATTSNHKRQKLPLTLSDGCLPRSQEGLQEMLQLARATQLRRIIQMILLRDRNGLLDMSRRVNIAALIGVHRFDPDNLQLLELNNGLPMIAPRRREADQGMNPHRLGAGVLGIPQMVAAGLLPTARDLANSVELMVGRGRIRRLPPVGRQRYVPITVVDPPPPRHVNDVNLMSFLATSQRAHQALAAQLAMARNTSCSVPDAFPLIHPQAIPRLLESSVNNLTRMDPSTTLPMENLENDDNNLLANLIVGQTPNNEHNPTPGTATGLQIGAVTSRDSSTNDMPAPVTSAINQGIARAFRQYSSQSGAGNMVIIPVFTDSDE